jgi:hypothetical protein
MQMKLVALIACTFLFSGAGFASTLDDLSKTPKKEIQSIPTASHTGMLFSRKATGQLEGHPEIHIMYARDQIISSLQKKLDALHDRIAELNASIAAIHSARATRAPIHTISFAELKEIVDEVKTGRK